jgi:peroxiredoxin
LAEYAGVIREIRALGADVAALSVDSAERSAVLREELRLPFPILGDTRRRVVREWDLYNPKEMGGIAVPAVFVIDPDRQVRFRSIDSTARRVSAAGALGFLRGAEQAPMRSVVRPGLRDFARAFSNAIRRGARTPEPKG